MSQVEMLECIRQSSVDAELRDKNATRLAIKSYRWMIATFIASVFIPIAIAYFFGK